MSYLTKAIRNDDTADLIRRLRTPSRYLDAEPSPAKLVEEYCALVKTIEGLPGPQDGDSEVLAELKKLTAMVETLGAALADFLEEQAKRDQGLI